MTIRGYSLLALLAAILGVNALMLGLAGAWTGTWTEIALAGVVALVALVAAVLSVLDG